MSTPIGVEVEVINQLSEHIRKAWKNYFWEYRMCQHIIRFSTEERTNYFSDLLNYFDDITGHLQSFQGKENYHSALYDAVAVLQFMYIQQDLIDEILTIFKLPQSSSNDKDLVRQIRNELIGHPVSRDRDKNLVSSVFITGQTNNTTLQYVRYHRDNNFSHNIRSFDWRDIFDAHDKYLKLFLTLIAKTIEEKLLFFKTKLEHLYNSLSTVAFEKLVGWVNQLFEAHYENNRLYKKENILHCFQKKESHQRYKHAMDEYIRDLGDGLVEVIKNIEEFKYSRTDNWRIRLSSEDIENVTVNFVRNEESSTLKPQEGKSIRYEFGKLFEKHPVSGVEYFIRAYSEDPELVGELSNMKENIDNDAEYYASYQFLKLLFKKRGIPT